MERTVSVKGKIVKISELTDIQLFEALNETMATLPLLPANSNAYMEQLREFGMLKREYSRRKKEKSAEIVKAEQEFQKKLRKKITGDLAEVAQRAGFLGSNLMTTRTAGIMPVIAKPRPISERISRTAMDIRRRNKINRTEKARAEKVQLILAKLGMQRKPK